MCHHYHIRERSPLVMLAVFVCPKSFPVSLFEALVLGIVMM